MEVGPLARVLAMYATGNPQVKDLVDMVLTKLDVPVKALFSTLGPNRRQGNRDESICRCHAHLLR